MLELRVLHDVLHRVHDLRHTGLVVSSEQRSAVSGDDGLALVSQQFRELGRPQEQARHTFQCDVSTVVVLDDLRLDILSGSVRRRIHVRDEAYGRNFLVNVGRDGTHDVAVLVQGSLHAHIVQLLAEQLQQIQFLGSAWL